EWPPDRARGRRDVGYGIRSVAERRAGESGCRFWLGEGGRGVGVIKYPKRKESIRKPAPTGSQPGGSNRTTPKGGGFRKPPRGGRSRVVSPVGASLRMVSPVGADARRESPLGANGVKRLSHPITHPGCYPASLVPGCSD